MKRSLFITIVVLLMATLFVSCNADKSLEDQLGSVSIAETSRSLTSSAELNVNVENLYWYYTAVKNDNSMFTTGATGTTKTPVKATGKGLAGANLGKFSTGAWLFSFYGYEDVYAEGAEPVYYQTGMDVTVAKNVSAYLTVTLTPGEGMADPKVAIVGATWYYEYAGTDKALTLKVYDGEFEATKTPLATIENVKTTNGKATFSTTTDFELTVGEHTLYLYVYYPANDNQLVGQSSLKIEAKAGLKYTINDLNDAAGFETLDEDGAIYISGSTNPDVPASAATGTISVTPDDTTVVKAGVAPISTKQTTVTFPAGSFAATDEGTHELTIAVADAAAAADTSFIVTDTSVNLSGAPIAVLSFALTDSPATFGDYVEVETYIQTGLDPDSIKVIYNGADGKEQPKDVTYTANNGKLTFKTKHFSEYVVVSTAAVARIGNNLYETFAAAFAAVKNGETLVLLKNTEGSINLHNGGTVTIDINGTTFNGGEMWITDDSTLIVDGSKAGSKVLGSFYIGRATNNNGNLVLNGGEYVCSAGATAIHINGTCLDSDVTIQNASITSPDDNGIQLNGFGTFLIENSTITGATAIYIKSGVLTINGGNYTGNMNPVNYTYNGNGANATGDAIVIDSCEYPGGAPSVTINSGTFTGTKNAIGYYQYDGSKPSDGILEDAIINVNGGTFNGVESPVALVRNGAAYATLNDAVADAGVGSVIIVLRDVENAEGMSVAEGKNFTVDFGGHTYVVNKPGAGSTGTETNAFQLLKNSTIVMKNGVIRISNDNLVPATVGKNIKRIIQSYADLTLDGMKIYAENQYEGERLVLSFNNGNVVLKNGTQIITSSNSTVAFDSYNWLPYYPSVSVTIEAGVSVNGKIEIGGGETNRLTISKGATVGGVVAESGYTLNSVEENDSVVYTISK